MSLRVFLLVALLLLAGSAAGALVLEDGGTHLVDTDQTGKEGGVQVHDGPGPASTTVTVSATLERGASVTGISSLTLDGTTTGGSVFALDDAELAVMHSDVGNDVFANHTTTVTVHDVTVLNNIFALGYAQIDVSQATVGDPVDTGGRNIFANDAGHITVHTGSVVLDDVFTNDSATIVIEDAEIGQRMFANGSSRIDFSGGSVALDIQSNGTSVVRIFGVDFAVDGTAVPFGPVAALSGTLTGELADGSPLDNAFTRQEMATILLEEVPEPAAPLLLLAGAAVLAGRRGGSSPTC